MPRQPAYHDDFGTLSGSATNKYWNNLNEAISACGASPNTLYINYDMAVTASTTVPSTLQLVFGRAGKISVPLGKKLIINGPIVADGDRQIFEGLGVIDGLENEPVIKAVWFGAFQYSLEKAISLTTGKNRTLELSPAVWYITADMTIPNRLDVVFRRGAQLSIGAGKTLTFGGRIIAGRDNIFTGFGTLAGYFDAEIMYQEWTSSGGLTTTNFLPERGCLVPKLDSGVWKPYWRRRDGTDHIMEEAASSAGQWIDNVYTIAYVAANKFEVTGDLVADVFPVGRRVRCTLGAGYVYSYVTAVSEAGGDTTVTLGDSDLDITISAANAGVIAPGDNGALPTRHAIAEYHKFIETNAVPTTGANQGAVFTDEDEVSGNTELRFRGESNETVQSVTRNGIVAGSIPIGGLLASIKKTAHDGFLLCSGETIGPVGSGADYESALYETLFKLIWNEWNGSGAVTATVGGGRGASANADWAAGSKTITLPDLRGRTVAGDDDMGGGGAASRITSGATFDGSLVGQSGGDEEHTLTSAEMPSHTHTGPSHTHTGPNHRHTYYRVGADTYQQPADSLNRAHVVSTDGPYNTGYDGTGATGSSGDSATASAGSGDAHANVQPTIIMTYQIRYA